MDWQLTIAVVLVAGSVCYLGWTMLRSWKASKSSCSGGCACSKNHAPPKETLISPKDLVLRKRD